MYRLTVYISLHVPASKGGAAVSAFILQQAFVIQILIARNLITCPVFVPLKFLTEQCKINCQG